MGFQPTWGRKREESCCDREPERFLTSISIIMAAKKLPCLRAYICVCLCVGPCIPESNMMIPVSIMLSQ